MAKAHTLVDNFNDNDPSTGSLWQEITFANPIAEFLEEVNQRIEIRARVSGSGTNLAGRESSVTYDLTNSEARVEVVQALSPVTGTTTYLAATVDASNRVLLSIEAGRLRCVLRQAGADSEKENLRYDPQKHRWLRLRHQLSNIHWEASADGITWVLLARSTHTIALTAVKLSIIAGTTQAVGAPGMAVFDNFNVVDRSRERRVEERRLSVRALREQAAELATERRYAEHHNNNDEVRHPERPFVGLHSKSLVHDSLGDPDPHSYGTLLRALESRDPADFEEIRLATGAVVKLTNPQSGLAFELEGADAQELTQRPAPAFSSRVTADEAGELYWMALARDIPFISWQADSANSATVIFKAIDSLNTEFPNFGGTVPVTHQNLFRGVYIGEQVGPYVSQFLLKGNVDPRKATGTGRDAADGQITYGTQVIGQKQLVAATGSDYLHIFSEWLDVQNGVDTRGDDVFDTTRRFIHTLRDGATYVHFDVVLNAFYNAALYLLAEPTGNQSTFQAGITGRPMVDMEVPFNVGNPYSPPPGVTPSLTQSGFATFGPIHLLQVLCDVLGRTLRAVWWQKWGVHRRLRPEEYGARVHNQIKNLRAYAIDDSILLSLSVVGGKLRPFYGDAGETFPNSYLLPQAYPEGSPTHPAYGAGHASGAGACATILKAFFQGEKTIENPVQANLDGTSLVSYSGTTLTVEGELNKLAGNIALFRNAAGVHWRSDYTESLPLGEEVAIRLLQEMSLGYNEDDAFFQFRTFDGRTIRIHDGVVEQVLV